MGATTKIEWCDHTFNPWRGCARVAAGCANCYAERQAKRNPRVLGTWGPEGERVIARTDAYWRWPLRWNGVAEAAGQRHRVFCGSMMDVFEDRADLEQPRERLFSVIESTPCLDWLLLTKRPQRAALQRFRENVWVGWSVSTQEEFDRDHWHLVACQAAVRFLSLEPLLGPIDFGDEFWESGHRVDWVIAGGESGPIARACDLAWLRSIRDQCRAAYVPCFIKQLGGYPLGSFRLNDPKGGDPDEWPEDLRVREFPASSVVSGQLSVAVESTGASSLFGRRTVATDH